MASGHRFRFAFSVLALFVALGLAPSSASAQGETIPCSVASDLTEARQAFEAGRAAAADQRWTDAEERMRRAFELSCRPSALLNVGLALRSLGRFREARDALRQLLAMPGVAPEERAPAQRYLQDVSRQVAALELVDVPAGERPDITLDGRVLTDDGGRPIRLEADPGTHSLVLRLDEFQPFLWNGELAEGQVRRVTVSFEPIPTREESFEWGWIVLGVVAAAVIGGGVALGLVLQEEAQLQPLSERRVDL